MVDKVTTIAVLTDHNEPDGHYRAVWMCPSCGAHFPRLRGQHHADACQPLAIDAKSGGTLMIGVR